MSIIVYRKYCISSLIVIAVLALGASYKIESFQNEAALQFAQKWLATPRLYIGVLLPNKHQSNIRDIIRLTKKINSECEGKHAYFIVTSNITKYKTIAHTQKELIWYPFDIENYDTDCRFLDSSRYDRLYKKHFLFLDENRHKSFGSCKIRFDSNLVIYRKKLNDKTTVEFEEIYKIDENDSRLEKNTLGEITYLRNKMRLSLLNSSIWNRRKSLNGKVFNAVSLNGSQITMTVQKSRDTKGNIVIHHSGYHADIIKHLMQALNFSLNTTVSDRSYNDIVTEVGLGRYEIGLNEFSHTLSRNDYVDFSLELLAPNVGLFYVKEHHTLYMNTFLDPFASHTWILIVTYIMVFISGFILVAMMIGENTRVSTFNKTIESLQTGLNLVLRSLISKRQGHEPQKCSFKISFLVVVLAGFLIFSMYRGVLVAFLATEEDNPPLFNLKELINSDYSLAVRKGTSLEKLFLDAATDSDEYQVYKRGKIVFFRGSGNIFANLMAKKDPKAVKTVLIYWYDGIKKNNNYPCKLALIKGSKRKFASECMVFKKKWQWTEFFNYHLLRMKESGLIEILYNRNMEKLSISCPNEYSIKRIVKKPGAVGTNKTFSLYVALVAGFGASLLLLLAENLSARQHLFMLG